MVRMRSPVRIWLSAPEAPSTLFQWVRGFSYVRFCPVFERSLLERVNELASKKCLQTLFFNGHGVSTRVTLSRRWSCFRVKTERGFTYFRLISFCSSLMEASHLPAFKASSFPGCVFGHDERPESAFRPLISMHSACHVFSVSTTVERRSVRYFTYFRSVVSVFAWPNSRAMTSSGMPFSRHSVAQVSRKSWAE